MASGHVYRVNRPNTWLLRPMLRREDCSCQPGAVHTWPICEGAPWWSEVRSLSQSGPDLLNLSSSRFDPELTFAVTLDGVDL